MVTPGMKLQLCYTQLLKVKAANEEASQFCLGENVPKALSSCVFLNKTKGQIVSAIRAIAIKLRELRHLLKGTKPITPRQGQKPRKPNIIIHSQLDFKVEHFIITTKQTETLSMLHRIYN